MIPFRATVQLIAATTLCAGLVAFKTTTPARSVALTVRPAAALTERAWRGGAEMSPRPFERFSVVDDLRDSIVALARAQVGKRYTLGGASPQRGFDCSGLVRWVFGEVFVPPPRTASQQSRIGAPIDRHRLRPGDLLMFGNPDSVSHVGIYVGEGKFVHASSVAGRVIVSRLDRPRSRLIRPFRGARRVLATAARSDARDGD